MDFSLHGEYEILAEKKNKQTAKLKNIVMEYKLNQNNLPPSKSPSLFEKKLKLRMRMYYNNSLNSFNL